MATHRIVILRGAVMHMESVLGAVSELAHDEDLTAFLRGMQEELVDHLERLREARDWTEEWDRGL